jgi:hypothetical protein
MSDETFTAADLDQASKYETLGPAYFAARRMAEALMQGAEVAPLKVVADKVADDVRVAVYDYIEGSLLSDLESNLKSHVQQMVDRTVQVLLTGEEWALKQYPMAKYHDGEAIRAAVARHCSEPLVALRITELEKEVARLTELLKWYRDR